MQTTNQQTLTTKKGTVLPLVSLKGKVYLQVAHRLVWFREEHPDWSIETAVIKDHEDYATIKAAIFDEKGKIMATAHKTEHKAHFFDYLEKAETGAIGRALALVGYGTQFAPEMDEEERIVDSPVIPANRTVANTAPATNQATTLINNAHAVRNHDTTRVTRPLPTPGNRVTTPGPTFDQYRETTIHGQKAK